MKIAYLVPGNGGQFYCENCQRDAAYLKALKQAGHQVVSVPLYLPLSGEQTAESVSPLFFGAVGFYLRETVPFMRSMPSWLRRLADSPALLSFASRQADTTSAQGREDLTLTMLRGADRVFVSEAEAVAGWLGEHFRPDIVHISNILLIGLVPTLKRLLGVPVVITLQDEHTWLDSFRPGKAEEAWRIIRRQLPAVAGLIPVSDYYRDFMASRLGNPDCPMFVVKPGIDLAAYPERPEPPRRRIGFLSHWSRDMGLGCLIEAFIEIRLRPGFEDVGLLVCGGGTPADAPFLRGVQKRLRGHGLGKAIEFRPDFGGPGRARFLADTTVLSVPSVQGEAYGSFILEALASGIPVVQPRIGGFTELVESSGGGLLVDPGDAGALAATLAGLLADDGLRRRLGSQGRQAVQATRGLADYAGRLELAYGTVLRAAPRAEGSR